MERPNLPLSAFTTELFAALPALVGQPFDVQQDAMELFASSPVLAGQPFEVQEMAIAMKHELHSFSNYRVKRVAAVNGCRLVFEALASDKKGLLAIKAVKLDRHVDRTVPPPDVPSDQKASEMEIKILRALSSSNDITDNLVHLQDAFYTPNFLFIVTQWCGGGDLFDYLHTKLEQGDDLSNETELTKMGSWFSALVSALALVHNKGFAHRDLSPENILLGYSNDSSGSSQTVKLHDFGLACSKARQSAPVGKLMYAAPELMCPVPNYDPQAADIWSLGIVFFSMMSKHVPMNSARVGDAHFVAFKKNPGCYVDLLLSSQKLESTMCAEAKDLFLKMTKPDPAERLTVEGVLQHPFVVCHQTKHEVKPASILRRRARSLEGPPVVKFARRKVIHAMGVFLKGAPGAIV